MTIVVCGVPAVAAMLAGAVLVRLKVTGVAMPATVALTVNAPIVPFALMIGAVATPEAFVTAVVDAAAPKVPEAPEPGAVNVTVAPDTGLLDASNTVACSWVPKFVLINVTWGVPAVAAMDAGAVLVNVKVNVRPPAVAVTV